MRPTDAPCCPPDTDLPPGMVRDVRLNKSTRYALYAATEMAAVGDGLVTVGAVARRYRLPLGALAKVFQQLVRAGIAAGPRGIGGGYRLARPAGAGTMLDVVRAYEPGRGESECPVEDRDARECSAFPSCRLRHVFHEVDEMVRCTFASVTLETLVSGGRPAPVSRAPSRPAPRSNGKAARRRRR